MIRTRCWGFSFVGNVLVQSGDPIRNSPALIRTNLMPIELVTDRPRWPPRSTRLIELALNKYSGVCSSFGLCGLHTYKLRR